MQAEPEATPQPAAEAAPAGGGESVAISAAMVKELRGISGAGVLSLLSTFCDSGPVVWA